MLLQATVLTADEEIHLNRFFGDEYVQYSKKVGSGFSILTRSK